MESPKAQLHLQKVISNEDAKVFGELWQSIWLEQGYADSINIEERKKHYKLYETGSVDFLVKEGSVVLGTMRIIRNINGLPVLDDFGISSRPWGSKEIVEVTLFTVSKEFRGAMALPLMKEMYQYVSFVEGAAGIVAAADRRLNILLKKFFLVEKIGEEKVYEGSITYPLYIDFERGAKVLRQENPELLDYFTKK